jgi:DNA-binding SARP family transcriptional activator
LRFAVLGPFEVTFRSIRVKIPGLRQRRVLATLALTPNAAVSVDRLVDVLWAESPPRTAREQVQNCIGQVAKVINAYDSSIAIDRRRNCYTFVVDEAAVDVSVFRGAATNAAELERTHRPSAALGVLGRALDLWRGDPLLDVCTDGLLPQIVELRDLHLHAVERYVGLLCDAGEHNAAIARLRTVVAMHPLNERLRGRLMHSLHEAGRVREALRAFDEIKDVLAEELGVEPGPELHRLHRDIAAAASPTRRTELARPSRRAVTIRQRPEVAHLLAEATRLLATALDLMAPAAPSRCAACHDAPSSDPSGTAREDADDPPTARR